MEASAKEEKLLILLTVELKRERLVPSWRRGEVRGEAEEWEAMKGEGEEKPVERAKT